MYLCVCSTPEEVDTRAAEDLLRHRLHNPHARFSFAGGNTTKSFHQRLVALASGLGIDFDEAEAFGLDEYLTVAQSDPRGVACRLTQQVIGPLGFSGEHIHLFDGQGDAQAQCAAFESMLEERPVDYQLLGLGPNGHLAFNEPGTPFGLGCHVTPLTPETVAGKAALFGGDSAVPREGITAGIRSIMRAGRVVLLVKGGEKAEIVRRAMLGPVSEEVPASVLQLHPNAVCFLDREAAGSLQRGKKI